ncbi:MAG TPA: CDGSH iron-sulfur domain-containing protein [Fimbriimonadaceae bacterium]|nr:CDGSH iron-sulfur domain-containing protein [Fimbriimonadaceae bacterium]
MADTYKGRELTVIYDSGRCLNASECVNGLPAVFNGDNEPWINPDGASAEEVVKGVCRCPTGALQVQGADGSSVETPDAESTVRVTADGPLHVRGQINFLDPNEDVVFTETRVALCRCGKSKNKPFCDDSHLESGFCHTAHTLEGKVGEAPAGPGALNIEPLANGPLFLTGSFKIYSTDGAVVCAGSKTALCRCGLSENKPFCDGSHKEGGFEAPVLSKP